MASKRIEKSIALTSFVSVPMDMRSTPVSASSRKPFNATPWRQVHAMLMEAATRTPGVATDPKPYVVQTALSDFYVEYRLCAQSNKNAPSRRVEAMNQLHANVLDVFNEQGVQIMSPHYMADPPQPQIVPPGAWSSQAQEKGDSRPPT